ncbi:penicillin-binding transpeptidase domain-containing protein [Herbihabitans rhizosphaerae]|uniref:penicillin-binding transpeptidase domain-containing protein n=1 Tax=Herbihabitans rhizosphaerae TaxID=1872711 RepID=UPI00102C189B|nr:penicillin-binding transpeptidase domain-containing protein [Herbihabitans rhizosphaerae]
MSVARRVLCALSVVALVLSATACSLWDDEPTPQDVARQFLAALAGGDSATAAGHTDAADSARPLLDDVRKVLKPASLTANVDSVEHTDGASTARAKVTLNWDLGRNRRWQYPSELELRTVSDVWKVRWAPTALHPKLAAQQTIAVRDVEPELAPVLDRDGGPLLSPDRVVSVVLDPAKAGDVPKVAGALASAIGRFDPSITQQSIVDSVNAKPGQPYQVVSLRDTDYQQVKPHIYELPGVRFSAARRLLATDRALAPQLLPGIRKIVEEQVAGKSGWRVVTLNSAGAEVEELHAQQPEPARAVSATLSRSVQAAAEGAIDPHATPAMLVAIQPSSGEVLAVAQNPAADAQGALALTGRYPPGSTFKIVTGVAALEAGTVTADTPQPCPGTTTIGGRLIPNNNRAELGVVPLRQAFAASCNTTFAKLAEGLGPDALTAAARKLGVGVDFVMPGITTVTGSVPPATNVVERAEDGFGQGKVLASPFGMAVAVSSVASGAMPKPTLLRGTPTTANVTPEPVPGHVLEAMRSMMRDVVVSPSGTGGAVARFDGAHGKTGTAQFGDGTHSHGWFVGFRGDLALAVLVTDAGSSAPATDAAAKFLGALG